MRCHALRNPTATERNRLTRMLRILDIGEDTFLPSPVRRNAKRKHMSELGIDISRSPRARKRKRPANTMKAVNGKKRAALSKHDRLQDQNKSITDRVLQTTQCRRRSSHSPDYVGDQRSSCTTETPEPCVSSDTQEPSSGGPESVLSTYRNKSTYSLSGADGSPSIKKMDPSFLLNAPSEVPGSFSEPTEPFVNDHSVDASVESEVRNIFENASSPEIGPLPPEIGLSSPEFGPSSPENGPLSKSGPHPNT